MKIRLRGPGGLAEMVVTFAIFFVIGLGCGKFILWISGS